MKNRFYQNAATLLLLAVLLAAPESWSQRFQYLGPESGTIAGGEFVSTDDFGITARIPERREPKEEEHDFKLQPNPPDMIAPAAPARSNEFLDASIAKSNAGVPLQVSSFEGIRDVGASIPPDPHLAAGPDHLIATVNSQFAIMDKSGQVLKLINADEWYNNVFPGTSPCDPQVVYDFHDDRWIMVWIECGSSQYTLFVSVSDDEDPLGTWCNWAIPGGQNGSTPTGLLNDYPKLGIDQQALYVTVNMFNLQGQDSFVGSRIRIIPKAQLLDNDCGPVTWTDIWDIREPDNVNQRVFTIVPAVTYGTPGVQYFVSDSPYQTGTFMSLWLLTDPTGNPNLIGINVPVTASIGFPSNADQLGGSSTRIDVGGRRVRNAVYMAGSVWTAHSVPGGADLDYTFARYVRIDASTFQATEDVALGSDGFWYYYPAVQPDAAGNLFMVFTRSGLNEYANARLTGRRDLDPPGLLSSATIKEGEANYVRTFGGSRNRWGDYLGIGLDPADGSRVWMLGQYAASNLWGTWVAEASYTPLAGRHLRFEPLALEFDTLEVGQTSPGLQTLISSVGTENLTVTSIDNPNASFVVENIPPLPATLSSFEDIALDVRFAPVAAGSNRDTLTILTDAPDHPEIKIALSGHALGFADFRGTVRDSLTGAAIRGSIIFLRRGETEPRAVIPVADDGAYAATLLEGVYDLTIIPEIPYPETQIASVVHSLAGSERNIMLNPAAIVMVEDDSTGVAGENLRLLFDQLGYPISVWDRNRLNETVPAERLPLLAAPGILLWATGATSTEVLSRDDRLAVISHLENGGNLILTGDNIAESSLPEDSLLSALLGVAFDSNDPQVLMKGIPGDPIGDGLITGAPGDSKDRLRLLNSNQAEVLEILHYGIAPGDTIRIAAIRAREPLDRWRAVYFGFRLEEVTQINRKTVLQRTIDWLGRQPVAVAERRGEEVPGAFRLAQNYPNPFNPTTVIAFDLPQPAEISLKVHDLLGKEVVTLASGHRPAGSYEVVFDAGSLAGGVYIYELKAGGQILTRKLTLVK